MIIGYARVSTKDQNLDRQIKELESFGCEKIFTEKHSGKNFKDRTVYHEMSNKLRFYDVLVIHDLSRLGRNKEEIKNEWKSLTDDEIDIVVLNMPILNTTQYKDLEGVGQLVSDIVFNLLSWLVEEERNRIKQAQQEGIEIAKEKGKYKGRKRKKNKERKKKYNKDTIRKDKLIYYQIVKILIKDNSVIDIHNKKGVARNTNYRIRKEYKND